MSSRITSSSSLSYQTQTGNSSSGASTQDTYRSGNSDTSNLSLFFSTDLADESIQHAIRISQGSHSEPNREQLFNLFLRQALSENPVESERTLTQLLRNPSLLSRERCYLLCELAYLQLNQGAYREAIETTRTALSTDLFPLHRPYLYSLQATCFYLLNEYREVLCVIEQAPLSSPHRAHYYLSEKKALVYMKERRFNEAERSLQEAGEMLAQELSPPEFPTLQTVSAYADVAVYTQFLKETKNELAHRLEQLKKIHFLLKGEPAKVEPTPPVREGTTISEIPLQDTLLYFYALMLQDKIRDAKKLDKTLAPDQGVSNPTQATLYYLRSILLMYRGRGDEGISLLATIREIPLIIPLAKEEKLFCELLLKKNEGNRDEAFALYQKLIQSPSLSNETKEQLELQKIEFAWENALLLKAGDACETFQPKEKTNQARLLICKAKIEAHKGEEKKALQFLEEALALKELPPLLDAYILSLSAQMSVKIEPQNVQAIIQKASLLLDKQNAPPQQKTTPLRADAFYLSDFERRPPEEVPPGVSKETITQSFSTTISRLDLTSGATPRAVTQEKSPSLSAFLLYKKGDHQNARVLLADTLANDKQLSTTERAHTLHLLSFLLALEGKVDKIKPFLDELLKNHPLLFNKQEILYWNFLLLLFENQKAALLFAEKWIQNPENLSKKFVSWLQLEQIRLSYSLEGIEKPFPANSPSNAYVDFIKANQRLLGRQKKEALALFESVIAAEGKGAPLSVLSGQMVASIQLDFRNFKQAYQALLDTKIANPKIGACQSTQTPDLLFSEMSFSLGLYPFLFQSSSIQREAFVSSYLLPMIIACLPGEPHPIGEEPQKNPFLSYVSFLATLYRNPKASLTEAIDTQYSLLAPAHPLSPPEQRICLMRAFLSFTKGDADEELLLLKELLSAPNKEVNLPGESLFVSEKLYCKALANFKMEKWGDAEQALDLLLQNTHLSPNQQAHLYADQAFTLLQSDRPSNEQILALLSKADSLAQTADTKGYILWVRTRVALSENRIDEVLRFALQGLQPSLSSKPITMMLLKMATSASTRLKRIDLLPRLISSLLDTYQSPSEVTYCPSPDLYLQNMEKRPFGMEALSPGDFLPSALLEISSAHNALGNVLESLSNADLGLKQGGISPTLKCAFHVRKAICYLQKGDLKEAKKAITNAIAIKPLSDGVLREAHLFSVLISLLLRDFFSQQSLDIVIDLSPPEHPFYIDAGILKTYFHFQSTDPTTNLLSIKTLLQATYLPVEQHAYLLAITAFLEPEKATELLNQAKELLPKENPIRAYVSFVSLVLENKLGITMGIKEEISGDIPPVLRANFHREEVHKLLAAKNYEQAVACAKAGLAALTEKDPPTEISYPFYTLLFSHLLSKGYLVGSTTDRITLASDLHFLTCCAYEKNKSYALLEKEAERALTVPSLTERQKSLFLYFQAKTKVLSKDYISAQRICQQLVSMRGRDPSLEEPIRQILKLLKGKVKEWVDNKIKEYDLLDREYL